MTRTFYNCTNLNSLILGSNIFYIKTTKEMFYNCSNLISFNFSSIKSTENTFIDMSYMFYNCQKLESIISPSDAQSISINNMKYMFYNCESIKEIDLTGFNSSISNPIDMSYLFYNCIALDTIIFDNYTFYISNASNMFYNCIS
jgi:surface protein